MKLRIGTRGSKLALWQANYIGELLCQVDAGVEIELCVIKTKGDRTRNVPFAAIGSKGVFVKEIEDALLGGRIELGVHSLKDMPTQLPRGLVLGAVTKREEAWDVLVTREGCGLDELKRGAKVGTGSLRRAAQLRAYRRDLEIVGIRGNVDTRLRKLHAGEVDATVLAAAGLMRLGLTSIPQHRIPYEVMLPAMGQGALGIEVREGEFSELLGAISDEETFRAIRAERALLRRLGGGCRTPIGCLGEVMGSMLSLEGVVCDPEGRRVVRWRREGDTGKPEDIGEALAEDLLARGARKILEEIRTGY
jgi:hydroxymethylbilane synthase